MHFSTIAFGKSRRLNCDSGKRPQKATYSVTVSTAFPTVWYAFTHWRNTKLASLYYGDGWYLIRAVVGSSLRPCTVTKVKRYVCILFVGLVARGLALAQLIFKSISLSPGCHDIYRCEKDGSSWQSVNGGHTRSALSWPKHRPINALSIDWFLLLGVAIHGLGTSVQRRLERLIVGVIRERSWQNLN